MHSHPKTVLATRASVAALLICLMSPDLYSQKTPSLPPATPTKAMAVAPSQKPSRAPDKGCKWEALSGAGLNVWVERCDYGTNKIDFVFKGNSLVQRNSDGGAADTVIDVIDLLANETQTAGVERVAAMHSSASQRKQCVVTPYKDGGKAPAGVSFLTFAPNAAYKKTLAKNSKSGDIADPPCGDWGTVDDGIQYFQVWPASTVRKFLFVRVGQDTPLFDEKRLQFKQ